MQELHLQIESRRSEVVQLSQQSVDDVSLTARFQSVAQRFEHVSAVAGVWRSELQIALVQCQDFRHTIDNLPGWLDCIDVELKALDPVDLRARQSELHKKHSKLKVFQEQHVHFSYPAGAVLFTFAVISVFAHFSVPTPDTPHVQCLCRHV